MMKICGRCNQEKETTEFYKDKRFADNLAYRCKECVNIDRRFYNKNNYHAKSIESMDGEIWEKILEWNLTYYVSNYGRVKSAKVKTLKRGGVKIITERLLNLTEITSGYYGVTLYTKDNVNKLKTRVHRLVANAFLPKTEGFDIVNHKNGDRKDNRVENLEWCNLSENITHSIIKSKTTSKYTGVYWNKKKWSAKIWNPFSKKKYHLGQFDVEEDASLAYQKAFEELNRVNKYIQTCQK